MAFDIERFVDLSKAVDTGDLDWDYIARVGISDDEARMLRYMADTESHTMLYLRDFLAGHMSRDPEVITFLACWVYEETLHGRAIDRFLSACGRTPDHNRYTQITKAASIREDIEAVLSHAVAYATPHFAATHMSWGAINEMTAALAYTYLARFTENKELTRLLTRLAKDERRHQSFYYHQAQKRLGASRVARGLAKLALTQFWGPVGDGVGETDTFGFIAALLFDNPQGLKEFRAIDRVVSKLPGLEGFDLVSQRIPAAGEAFKAKYPAEARRLRAVYLSRQRTTAGAGESAAEESAA